MRIPVIIGPTASGKTELSQRMGEYLPIEVVSADSRKIYRYLDIGTAKPSYYLRLRTRFHMIDICDPDHYFSAGDYGDTAGGKLKEIIGKDRIPLVVGGSGLYIEAIFKPLPPLPKPDPRIRSEIDNQEKTKGLPWLYHQLQKFDKEWAEAVDSHDRQRIKRGIEIFRMTGQPISELIKKRPKGLFRPFYIYIVVERNRLMERVKQRTERMFRDGLIDETRWLLNIGYREDLNALRTIGYQETIDYLKGSITEKELKSKVVRNTLLLAKRQITWFKRFKNTYQVSEPFPIKRLVSAIKRLDTNPL
ncbi:MAG TPA: tRNA (adenosine(37)-N6)-dimethylallyltransferase MiaA [bacterium (Candidatus Stahlbacteria)]|nr:tRNA (adenosine(37)-N6)-dimethylallyltransferase MiaA [Candidatus Stahlbacteria bacterium]